MSSEKRTIAPLFTWRSAISDSPLTSTERHCLLALSLYMNERGASAYPGSARLAHDTDYHVDTVKRALSQAAAAGWLIILEKGGSPVGGVRHASEYAANIPVDNCHIPVDNYRGSGTTGGPDAADRGSSLVRPGVQGLPITSMNTSENSRPDFSSLADPECFECHGNGECYHPGSGSVARCTCTKELAR